MVERRGRSESCVDDFVLVDARDDVGVNHDSIINVESVVFLVADFGFVTNEIGAEAVRVVCGGFPDLLCGASDRDGGPASVVVSL